MDGGIGEAMLISAAVGGGTSLATGQDPLKGAMMGGLMGAGGYGVSGLMGGASAIPAAGTAPVAAETATTTGLANMGQAGLGTGIGAVPGLEQNYMNLALPQQAGFQTGMPSAASLAAPQAAATPLASANPFAAAPTSFADVAMTGPTTPGMWDQAKNFYGGLDNTSKLGGAFAGGYGLGSLTGGVPGVPTEDPYNGPLSRFKYDPDKFKPSVPPGYADGGIAELVNENTPVAMMASGGIPGLLKGGGTGLSDSIPATIGNKQPARLADGEFVVSADVVSNLGGGSTDAGAKKLYAMMDRVRRQAHGSNKQIRKVSDKTLPV